MRSRYMRCDLNVPVSELDAFQIEAFHLDTFKQDASHLDASAWIYANVFDGNNRPCILVYVLHGSCMNE